jgi:AcrR family transcriptional regulator
MTKEIIVENAVRLFKLYGIKSVTMDDIACKIGISKKTLYLYFDTKEDILLACIDVGTAMFEKEIVAIKHAEHNPVFALAEIYRMVVMILSEYKGSYFYDIEKLHHAKEKSDKYRIHLQVDHVRALLEQAQEENYLRGDTDIDILCKIFFFLIDEFIADNAYIYPKSDLENVYKHIILFGLRGFLTKENGSLLDKYTG